MSHRTAAVICLLALLTILAATAQAGRTGPGRGTTALLYVELPDGAELARFQATGLPGYLRLHGAAGDYLLAGADTAGQRTLAEAGLSFRVLDTPELSAEPGSYYLAHGSLGRQAPDWGAYGRTLLDDGLRVLLHLSPQGAERLAAAGAELRVLTLEPKPLQAPAGQRVVPAFVAPDPLARSAIDQVSSATVYSYTGDLSGEWPVEVGGQQYTIATRHTDSGESIRKATQYVYEHLKDLGLRVTYHDWTLGGYTGRNVIGELTGQRNPDEIYILCAHLDDRPPGPLAPGADDNASGSVAVLVAADILSQFQWDCTLRFAFWTGEEQGLLGSAAYAQQAYQAGEDIAGVLNLDMIGWDGAWGPDIDLHASPYIPATLDLAQLFSDVVDTYDLNLVPEIIPNGSGASDHASFWDYGYPAILGIEDYYPDDHDVNPYYHTTEDLLQHLNIPYYTEFVRAAVGTFAHMGRCLAVLPSWRVYLPLTWQTADR